MKNVWTFIIIILFVVASGVGIYFAKVKANKNTGDTTVSQSSESGSVGGANSDQNIDTSHAKDLGIIFFYGSTCPHCQKVEAYLSANPSIEQKIKIDKKEVFSNQTNAQLMTQYEDKCTDLSADDKGGVPFLYTPTKCVVGDQPVIDYLTSLAAAQ